MNYKQVDIDKAYVEGYKNGGGELGERVAGEYHGFEEKIAQRVSQALSEKVRRVNKLEVWDFETYLSGQHEEFILKSDVVAILKEER
jgi:hypothetical protein